MKRDRNFISVSVDYREQTVLSTGGFGPQSAAKYTNDILEKF